MSDPHFWKLFQTRLAVLFHARVDKGLCAQTNDCKKVKYLMQMLADVIQADAVI